MRGISSKLQALMDASGRKRSLALLSAMIAFSVGIIYFQHLFGGKLFMYADIGSDTKNIYTPIYSSIVSKLRAGDFSMWDASMGLGSSLISFQSTIFDPFAVILYIAGYFCGVPSIAYALIFVNILKVFSAGYACYAMLGRYKFGENAKVLASYIYAFNGFMMLWGQHYFFATAVVITPLMLLCVEQALSKDRMWEAKLSLCTALLLIYSVYIGFMVLAFSFIYSVFRYLKRPDGVHARLFIRFIVGFTGCVALGALISSAVLLPVVYRMLEVGGRVGGGGFLSNIAKYWGELYKLDYYKTLVQRIFSNNFQGAGDMFYGVGHEMNSANDVSRSNYYEAPQLFFSVLLMLLMPTYFINSWKRNRGRLARAAMIAGALGMAAMLLTPIGGTVFNGFSYPFSRHTFLLMSLFAIMVASALDETARGQGHPIAVIVSAGFTGLAIALSFTSSRWEIMLLKSLTCLALAGSALVLPRLYRSKRSWRAWPTVLLTAIIMINVISESFITVNDRRLPPKDWVSSGQAIYDADTAKALEYIRSVDDGFYRVEKTYTPGTNEGMIQGYMGFAMYNSNISSTYGEFLNKVVPGAVLDVASSVFVPGGSIPRFLSVKYLLTRDDPSLYYGYEFLAKTGEVNILMDSGAGSIATLYDSAMSHSQFSSLPVLTRGYLLNDTAVIPDGLDLMGLSTLFPPEARAAMNMLGRVEISLSDITAHNCVISERRSPPMKIDGVSENAYIEIPLSSQGADILFEATLRSREDGRVSVNYVREGGQIVEAAALSFGLQADIPRTVQAVLPPDVLAVRITMTGAAALERVGAWYSQPEYSSFPEQSVSMDGMGSITLNVNTERDGLLVLSIPWEPGWTLRIDGHEQEIILSNLTFIGAILPAGVHKLDLNYRTPYMMEGVPLSLAGIMILIVLVLVKRKRGRL